MPRCAHCERPLTPTEPDDARDARAAAPLCAECLDRAVYGAGCPNCGRVPGSRPPGLARRFALEYERCDR